MKIVKSVTMAATALSVVVVGTLAQAAPLAGYWRLNEVSTASGAVDSTGNVPDGIYAATVDPTVLGPNPGFGTGAEFFGNGDVNIGRGTVLNFKNNFSTSAWVNFDNFSGKHSYLGHTNWAVRSAGDAPEITTFGVKDYTGTGGALMTAGTWYHVVTVMDANNDVQFYVDGAPAGFVTHTAPAAAGSNPFAIGARSPGDTFESMDGRVDDVGVFSTELTASDVVAIYSLAVEAGLQYDLGDSNTLLEAFANGDPSVEIDGVTWTAATGLTGDEGQVINLGPGLQGNDLFEINLSGGDGFQVLAVPEPASIAIWTAIGAVLFGVGWRRKQK